MVKCIEKLPVHGQIRINKFGIIVHIPSVLIFRALNFRRMIFIVIFSIFISTLSGHATGHAINCSLQDLTCLENGMHKVYEYVRKGMPEYKLPPIDPLTIPQVEIEPNDFIGFLQNYTNATLAGLQDIPMHEARIDQELGHISMLLHFDLLNLTALYDLQGKFLMLPVVGNGDVVMLFKNGTMNLSYDLEIVSRQGRKYFKGKNSKLLMDIQLAIFRFDNLFNGHLTIGKNLNDIFNDNWKPLFDLSAAAFLKGYGEIVLRKFNKVFQKMPIGEP